MGDLGFALANVKQLNAFIAHEDQVPNISETLASAMGKYCKNTKPVSPGYHPETSGAYV
jgi:hypothetical protein